MDKGSNERGQVLVLVILAIVVIFGFAALAIDVGRLYSERRRAQSAADAAAYAAAFASSQGDTASVYLAKGLASAVRNGFVDDDYTANLTKRVDVQVYNPPISGKYSVATTAIKPSEYYQVIIRTEVDKVFSQFVYTGPWFVNVEAVVRSTAKKSFADGNVIVATCADCCDALTFGGNPFVHVIGGDILSNSSADGSKSCYSGMRNGTGCILVEDGGIYTGGDFSGGSTTKCKDDFGDELEPPIQSEYGINENTKDRWTGSDWGYPGCVAADGKTPLPIVSSADYTNLETAPGAPLVLKPGVYTNGLKISGNNAVVQLEPGMYCMKGDLSVTSGSITGSGVMFAMFPKSGNGNNGTNIDISTTQTVKLEAPGTVPGYEDDCLDDDSMDDVTKEANFCWSGFLFYMPKENTGTISIQGGNSTEYSGTIYAPGPAKPDTKKKCTLTGNSETTSLNASLICYNVHIEGKGLIEITYKDKQNAQQPAMIELAK